MKVENVSCRSLLPADYNPRKISATELANLKAGLKEFGVVQPIVARRSDRLVIGGHQRLVALLALAEERGESDATAPVVWVDLDDTKAKALNLALNRIGGEWDFAKLAVMLDDSMLAESTVALTGFDLDELTDIQTLYASVPTPPPPARGDDTQESVNRLHRRCTLEFSSDEARNAAADILARFGGVTHNPESLGLAVERVCKVIQDNALAPELPATPAPVKHTTARRKPPARKSATGERS